MQLAALKIGAGVPEGDFTATIRSVFRRACLAAVDDGRLVTFVPAAAGGLPGGITIVMPADFDFAEVVVEGARIGARAGVLRLGAQGIIVDLRPAVPWRSCLDRLTLTLEDPRSLAAWQIAAGILAADGRAAALLAIARDAIPTLVHATRRLDAGAAEKAASSLVGLGAGGTPAGDDFLVGFLAAMHAMARRADVGAFTAALSRRIARLADRTNAVSAVYLVSAAEAEVSERLTDLVGAIADGAEAAAAAAASAAIAVGHSSGADGTLGLLAGALATTRAGVAAETGLFATA